MGSLFMLRFDSGIGINGGICIKRSSRILLEQKTHFYVLDGNHVEVIIPLDTFMKDGYDVCVFATPDESIEEYRPTREILDKDKAGCDNSEEVVVWPDISNNDEVNIGNVTEIETETILPSNLDVIQDHECQYKSSCNRMNESATMTPTKIVTKCGSTTSNETANPEGVLCAPPASTSQSKVTSALTKTVTECGSTSNETVNPEGVLCAQPASTSQLKLLKVTTAPTKIVTKCGSTINESVNRKGVLCAQPAITSQLKLLKVTTAPTKIVTKCGSASNETINHEGVLCAQPAITSQLKLLKVTTTPTKIVTKCESTSNETINPEGVLCAQPASTMKLLKVTMAPTKTVTKCGSTSNETVNLKRVIYAQPASTSQLKLLKIMTAPTKMVTKCGSASYKIANPVGVLCAPPASTSQSKFTMAPTKTVTKCGSASSETANPEGVLCAQLASTSQSKTSKRWKRLSCDICHEKFFFVKELSAHTRSMHPNKKPYSCHFCNYKNFAKNYLNNIHMRIHLPEVKRPFRCEKCTAKFIDRQLLQSHMFQHTGKKPF